MNSTPKRALQITPTQPARRAGARSQAATTPSRSGRPAKPNNQPPRRHGPSGSAFQDRQPHKRRNQPGRRNGPSGTASQDRQPYKKASHAPRRHDRPQDRQQGKLTAERTAKLVISGVAVVAELLNAIHRIRTGAGSS